MTWGAIVAGVVGAGASASGSAEASRRAKHQQENANFVTANQRRLRDRAADTLDNLAQKLVNGEPISAKERDTINKATQVASQQIERQRQQTQKNVLGAQAATGFLKSGRTARQLRRLNVEASEAQQKVEVQREMAIQQMMNQRRQQAMQALIANLGMPIQQQNIPQGLPAASLLGTGFSQLSGVLANQNANANALKLLQQQNLQNRQQPQQIQGSGGGAAVGIPTAQ